VRHGGGAMTGAWTAPLLVAVLSVFRLVGYLSGPHVSDVEIHRVQGEPRRVERGRLDGDGLTVVTWNIARGVQFEAVRAELQRLDADVILLQEVDRFCNRSGARDVARDLAAALDMNWVWAGEFQEVGESLGRAALTGQAVLSRTAIDDAQATPFMAQAGWRWSWDPFQPRRGGRIALRARTAGVVVHNVHLDSRGGDSLRARQVDDVLQDASARAAPLVLIAGDFNTSRQARESLVDVVTKAGFADVVGDRGQTTTSQNYQHAIDWMFARGFSGATGRVQPSTASDHYPVIGRLARR
jgi:endonuclease/exonuclease/phosphatase family metal-dependent hydrolase